MRRPGGNILLMAMFISVFLFFLSVALVAQNRQDVLLSVTREHRLRADNAARAGVELAMHVMRTDPHWPERLDGAEGDLETGGHWSVRPPQPLPGPAHLVEIQAEGTSGVARVTRRRVVEEIALAAPETPGPHLFARTEDGNLAVLSPDFRWSELGPAPDRNAWLVASGGPLFTHVAGTVTRPPVLQDLTPQGMQPVNLVVEPARLLTTLDVSEDAMVWRDLPALDAGPGADGTGGSPLYRSVPAVTEGTDYKGPSVDWYTLTGDALAADGRRIVAHANHYFYRGARGTVSGQGLTLDQPGRQFSSTAVVRYDLETARWEVLQDLMGVADLRQDPDLTPATETRIPNPDTLGLVDGRLYALERGNDRSVLQGTSRAWTFDRESPGLSRGLVAYGGRLRLHTTSGTEDGLARIALSEGLDPWTDLSMDRSGVTGSTWDTEAQAFEDRPLVPPMRIRANLLGDLRKTTSFLAGGFHDGSHCVAVQGPDLYTFARFQIHHQAQEGASYLPPFTPEFLGRFATREVVALAHYDGSRWQVWPGGLYEFSLSAPAEPAMGVPVGAFRLDPASLAAASYPGPDDERVERFAPVVDLP